MDLTAYVEDLTGEFTTVRLEHGGGQLVVPELPVDLGLLAEDHFPGEVDEYNAYQKIGDAVGMSPLIVYEWDEEGSPNWHSTLDVLVFGDVGFVTMQPDLDVDQPWEAFVMVRYPNAAEVFDALYFDIMWDNGESYGIELFSSLPTTIRSARLDKESIRAGLHLFIDWDETRAKGAWVNSATQVPSWMRQDARLTAAADALIGEDSEAHRDAFVEAYAEIAYKPAQ